MKDQSSCPPDKQRHLAVRAAAACLCGLAIGGLCARGAEGRSGYQKAPAEVARVLNAPPTPFVSVSPTRDHLLLVEWARYPAIADMAEPMLRLAGQRINPLTNGPHMPTRYVGMVLRAIPAGEGAAPPDRRVVLPAGAYLGAPVWSPNGARFAFTNTGPGGVELWIGDVRTGAARRIPNIRLNAAYGAPVQWMPDSRTLLCLGVPPGRGAAPAAPRVPDGPAIQESGGGRTAPVRTFQDLLRNAHDEALFEYYCASQILLVDPAVNRGVPTGAPGLIASVEPSPDGRFLLVERHKRPYSHLVPAFAFPLEVEIWDRAGKLVHRVASLPLAEDVPIGGVRTGPRLCAWQPSEPAAVTWVEAQDGGDPKRKVPHRDVVFRLKAPFTGARAELARTEHRFAGLRWTESGRLALLQEYDRDRYWERTFVLEGDPPAPRPEPLWDRSAQDRYGDPGTPLTRPLPNGHRVLHTRGDTLFLAGAGASPEGERPFLDALDLKTRRQERVFRAPEGTYESVVTLLDADGKRFLTRRETSREPPNYFTRVAGETGARPLTTFPDPAPQLRGIRTEIVKYRRADGVPLSFTLYLPPGYQEGQRLPTVVWAYPREFGDASTAGQVSGSQHRFTVMGGTSHLFFLTQGYAVLDDVAMPVVGPPATANDTFVEQVVASARAAIDRAVQMGVTDPDRVGVGGHSYGAFMTANLLAHSDLFRAGIARSGAYNRTLTPFGFQSERRTLWEAPEVYLKVSPFMHAGRINEPLLLIHGEADNNTGTFPIQSERLFHAIKGLGGTARYVSLPHESHGYAARESVEHTLHEMIAWFDRHVKNAPPRARAEEIP